MTFSRFIRLPLFLLALGCFITAGAQAGPKGKGPQARLLNTEKMKSLLDLNEEQIILIDELNTTQQASMKTLREQDFETKEDRQAAGKALMAEYQTSLKEILSTEQQEKLKAVRKEQRQKRRARRSDRADQ